jgi:hypothetical protein
VGEGKDARVNKPYKKERVKIHVADRGRASGLYRVGITGIESHLSPFTKWSKVRDFNEDFRVLNGHEQCRSKWIDSLKGKLRDR